MMLMMLGSLTSFAGSLSIAKKATAWFQLHYRLYYTLMYPGHIPEIKKVIVFYDLHSCQFVEACWLTQAFHQEPSQEMHWR